MKRGLTCGPFAIAHILSLVDTLPRRMCSVFAGDSLFMPRSHHRYGDVILFGRIDDDDDDTIARSSVAIYGYNTNCFTGLLRAGISC